MAVTEAAGRLRAQGVDVISLSAGEPDFDTPEHVKRAAIEAIREGRTKYTPASGLPELKRAVAAKLERENGLAYEPSQVLISCGAKHSIYNALQAMVDEGDEVLIPSPYWVSYPEMAKCAGAKPVILRTEEEEGFLVRPEQLRNALTSKSRLLILCSPSNPTGVVYDEAALRTLAEVILESGCRIISDEIYERLCFGVSCSSIAAVHPAMKERTVVVNGVSKAYAMTGWRIGYAAGPERVIAAMAKLQSQSTSNAPTPAQHAAVAALEGDQGCVDRMRAEYALRRDVMVKRLRAMPGVTCVEPQGAFYVFPKVSAFYGRRGITDSVSFASALLERARVAVVPGAGFGSDAYIRLSFATSMEKIEEGLGRLERFLNELG